MKKGQKILLSIPPVIGLLYMLTFIFPTKFNWLIPDMLTYYILTISISLSIQFIIAILIWKIWNYKNVEKSEKWNWTLLLLFFNSITILIYVWKIDDQNINENTVPNTV